MDTRFDQMTKILAEGIPRREALRRLAALFGGALLASRASAGDPFALGCACDNVPVGFKVKGGFATKKECEENGIPEEYADAVAQAEGFCGRVYKCIDPDCPTKIFVNSTTPAATCECKADPEQKGRWRAVCDLLDKTKCCCVPSCPTGETLCGTGCSNLNTDNNNCGACDHACQPGTSCSAGVCCQIGTTNCNGTCVDTTMDPNNCGSCGHVCSGPTPTCQSGVCGSGCPGTQTNCSGHCTDTMTDTMNCGTCGNVCASGASCTAGTCACPAGQIACNGACLDPTFNNFNCGSCNNACTQPNTICAGAACAMIPCTAGCPPGSACNSFGFCSPPCGPNSPCPGNRTCQNGVCI